MGALDTSIVNVSLPSMMADFGANIKQIEWVITAYMLAFAVLMPLTSWLRDRIGARWLYTGSLILFTAGSVLCGMAWNVPSLIFARVIQALGGGPINPIGMAMLTEVFEPHERGKAMGYWGLGVIIGPAIAPTLGGYLTAWFGWRSIFLINLPIGIIGCFLALEWLRKDVISKEHKPFDFWGFSFLAVFLISFLLGVSEGEKEGWTSLYILSCFVTAAISLVSFLITDSLSKVKIMDLTLFKSPVFSVAMLITAVRSIALYGGIFLLPLFLQQVKGLDAIQTGLLMFPGSLLMAFLMPITGKMSDKSSPRLLVFIGLIGLAVFMYMYVFISMYMSNWDIILPTLIRAIGFSLLIAPISATMMNAIPRSSASMASAMTNIIQQIAGAIGIAVLSTVLDIRVKFHMAQAGVQLSTSQNYLGIAQGIGQQVHSLGLNYHDSVSAAQGILLKHISLAEMTFAFQDAFLVAFFMVLIAIIPTFLLPNTTGAKKGVAAEPVIHGE